MTNLNTPAIVHGPLTPEQLDRRVNPGRIYTLHGLNGEVGAAMLMPKEQPMPAEAVSHFVEPDNDNFGAFYGLRSAFIITGCVAVLAYGVHLLAGYFN